MLEESSMRWPDLAISFDPAARTPRYRQVADGIRAAILDGRLGPRARLPATRALAEQLGVVRNVVAEAYDVLAGEGYVEARHGSGTYVSAALPDDLGRPVGAMATGTVSTGPASVSTATPPGRETTLDVLDQSVSAPIRA